MNHGHGRADLNIRLLLASVLVAAAGWMVTLSSQAGADETAFRDGDEPAACPQGGTCPDDDFMDFRRLTQGHGTSYRNVRHGIRTIKRWKTSVLGGRHGVTIEIEFNLDDDRAYEREIRIRKKNGRLWAGMFGGYFRPNHRIPVTVHVWRSSRYNVKVGFPADTLREGIDGYRWAASWGIRAAGCAGSCDNDNAPDRGWYTHPL